MAIFTFSTKQRKPEDTKVIEDVKRICERRQLNFSGVVVKLLKQWLEENSDHGAK